MTLSRITTAVAALLFAVCASGATFTVTNTNDTGPGSLRYAIYDADLTAGPDTIVFAIGSGPQLITPLSSLPPITDTTTIDGTTQPGYAGTPLIGVDGSLFISSSYQPAFDLQGGGSTVIGLSITNFHGPDATTFQGSAGVRLGATNCAVRRCYIGVGRDGNSAGGNDHGVSLDSSGGTVDGNVISGGYVGIVHYRCCNAGAQTNVITSNYIGLNAAGTSSVANIYGVGLFASGDYLAGNTVAGNRYGELLLSGSGITVRGNRIGVSAVGMVIPGSSVTASVSIYSALSNDASVTFGGPNPGDGNEVAGGSPGIYLQDAANTLIRGCDIHDNYGGITIYQSATTNIIDNRIRNNFGTGIYVGSGAGNTISENSIHDNSTSGIQLSSTFPLPNDAGDLDVGGNLGQNYPVLGTVSSVGGTTSIAGTLNSTPSKTYQVEFFSSPQCGYKGYGQGSVFIGKTALSTDGSGNASFSLSIPVTLSSGSVLTATATDPSGNTSEFSACATVQGVGTFVFSSSTASVAEGAGSRSLIVNRVGGTAGSVSVSYATAAGSASAGSDFTSTSGTLNFGDGETQKSFSVPILQDAAFEGAETFTVTLSNPTGGATVGTPATVAVTITDDDPPPTLTVDAPKVTEGDNGTTNMLFTVKLSAASPATTTLSYYTLSYTAYAGEDFQYTTGTLTLNPGETQKTIAVPIIGDTRYEQDELLQLYIYSVTNATLNNPYATGTILNDDPQPRITVSDPRVVEGNGGVTNAIVTLTANQPIYGELDYATADGTAKAGKDYQAVSFGYVYFSNETTKTIVIPIIGDTEPEPNEIFTLRFGYNGTSAIVDPSPAVVTIVNDDAGFGPKIQSIPVGSKVELNLDLGIPPGAPFTLALSSSNGGVLDLPSTMTISQAATVITATAKAVGPTTVTVTLPAPYSQTFSAQVNVYETANLVLKPDALVVPEGGTLNVSASFDPALKTSSTVQLSVVNTSLVEVPSSIVIEAGKTTTFTIKGLKKGSTALTTTLDLEHGSAQSGRFVDVVEPSTKPAIAQVTPANGSVAGGTNVTVSGANLTANCTLLFGGVPATNVTFVSATSMTATTPAHGAGAVDVLLVCGADSFNFANGFTYLSSSPIVSSVSPTFGSVAGGTLVRITGSNFRSGCWPFFGDTAARAAAFVSATEMIGDAPAHAAGKVALAVRCSGSADGSLADAFAFTTAAEPAAQINSVTPLAGAPGQAVTLTGIRFRHDDVVTFDNTPAALLSSSPDADVVRVPDLAAGNASITLTDTAGHSTTTGPIFTVLEPLPPQITSALPATVRPGTDLVLEGTGFRAGYWYALGGARAAIVSLSYTRVMLRVPDVAPATYPINVMNSAAKIASIGPAITVAANGPSITSLTPACSSTNGGGTLVVHGSGFEAGATATLDGVGAATHVVDGNTLTITIPAGAVGWPKIVISNPGGGSASLSGAFVYYSPFDPNGGCSGGRSRPLRH